MVVLEGGNMLPSASNQYLQPDYMSSLPTTLDAKNSPLALLAQTCSQIGVDTPTAKPLNSPSEKSKKSSVLEIARFSPTENAETRHQVISAVHKSSKLCEKKLMTKKLDIQHAQYSIQDHMREKTVIKGNSGRQSASPIASSTSNFDSAKHSPEQTLRTPPAKCASPIAGFGTNVLQDHSKDAISSNAVSTEQSNGSNNNSSACCSSSLEQTNPAFRNSFSSAPFNYHQQSDLFPSGYVSTSSGSYSNYIRLKIPGGETLLPLCKDPYCAGCQFNLHNQQLLLNGVCGSCPSGCNQFDHQKYNLTMAMPFTPGTVPSSLTYASVTGPYVCNWISGDTYCGKRFGTSEELLQHIRSHSTGIDTISVATSSIPSFLNPSPLFTSTSLHRPGYHNSVNPLSSVRYHPYNKTILQTLIGSSYSTINPTMFGPYLSPYTVYNQQVSAPTVHP